MNEPKTVIKPCKKCNGMKQLPSMGHIMRTCEECLGIGYTQIITKTEVVKYKPKSKKQYKKAIQHQLRQAIDGQLNKSEDVNG